MQLQIMDNVKTVLTDIDYDVWARFISLTERPNIVWFPGFCEHSNELLVFMKTMNFLTIY
jgi:hypothetical protein